VYGSRNYLMTIEQYHNVYKPAGALKPATTNKGEIEQLRNAVLAIECGDLTQVESIIARLGDGTSSKYRDYLWARFRAVSQRLMIMEALKAKNQDDSFDSYETYYSDFIDEEQLQSLEHLYR
jgi:hypothetical protein